MLTGGIHKLHHAGNGEWGSKSTQTEKSKKVKNVYMHTCTCAYGDMHVAGVRMISQSASLLISYAIDL